MPSTLWTADNAPLGVQCHRGESRAIGVRGAATELRLASAQIHDWRHNAQLTKARGQIDQDQSREIARLDRVLAEKENQLAIPGKAAAHLAEGPQ